MNELLSRIEPIPRRCSWEITLACNMRCVHCGSAAGKSDPNELTTIEALGVADQLAGLGCREVTLLGGEPFLRPDWQSITTRLISHGIETTFVSNGLLIDKDVARRLAEIGVNSIGLSLDGLETTHDKIRNLSGAFKRVLESSKILQEADLSVCAITVVQPENLEELPRLAAVLEKHQIEHWQLQLPIPKGRYHSETWLSGDVTKRLVNFIAEKQKSSPLNIYAGCNVGYLGENEEATRTADSEGFGFWTGCYAGVLLVAIRSNGDVSGCLTMPDEMTAGNLREKTLRDIWLDKALFLYNRDFDSNWLEGACASCKHADICRGGCRTMSYYLTGSLYSYPCCELLSNNKVNQIGGKEKLR